jgi:endonuclease/exonuclease/phosphatase family metal-dependent hydrolase
MKYGFWFACLLALVLLPLYAAKAEAADTSERAESADIRIMSYNILHPDWSHISVKGRDALVADIFLRYRPDVAAIQEAGAKWHKALKPLLVDTGFYAPACRQSNAEGFIYCTTTFLYNPQTVRLLEEEILDLEIRDATRVFSVAVFENIKDGARFIVCNTHPAPSEEEPEKYARNMADLTDLTVHVISQYAGLPVIIAGDFNTPEQSEQYLNYMRDAGVRDAKYAAETLVCGCSTYFGYQVSPDPDSNDSCIDHLFVNDGADVKLFNAIIGHDVQNASDHIPIYADIALK